jgi:predicted Zn-dependent peptidase
VLGGGLRVITEQMPTVRSAAVGFWIGVGSRHETVRQAGASHYLEHLLFKGTKTRSAREISAAFDRVGGDLNAFTTKDHTCFHVRVLGEDLPLAVDVLADMVVGSLIRGSDVEAERNVILEEIAMDADDPSDVVHDEFSRAIFGDAPLGRPVLGSASGIESISRGTINGYWRRAYRPERMVISAAGNVDHDAFVAAVEGSLGPWLAEAVDGPATAAPTFAAPDPARIPLPPAEPTRALRRRTEQANIVLGVRGLARTDDRRFALAVLSAALGGGMSSLLFQEIREKRGLAYSVYSFSSGYADDGMFGVYVGCHPKRVAEVVGLTRDQLAHVSEHGLDEQDLVLGRGQVRGAILLAAEDTESRMSWWGKRELLGSEGVAIHGVEAELGRIMSVSAEDVRSLAADLLARPPALAVVGAAGKLNLEALVA